MTKKVRSHDEAVRLAKFRDEFEYSSTSGRWRMVYKDGQVKLANEQPHRVYVIYSYGQHFPMYVYDSETEQWYGNYDKYSRTTSTHQSKYRPYEVAKMMDTESLKRVVQYGYVGYITHRMENGLQT